MTIFRGIPSDFSGNPGWKTCIREKEIRSGTGDELIAVSGSCIIESDSGKK